MHGASHRPRVLCINSDRDLNAELDRMGVAVQDRERILSNVRYYTLKLSGVNRTQASLIKEAFLSYGGNAIEKENAPDRIDIMLVGTHMAFRKAAKWIASEEMGSSTLDVEIEAAIALFESKPVSPDDITLPDPKSLRMIAELADRTLVMGILNVTPDSFSDGGMFFDHVAAVDHALSMIEDGADIIDIGGESTRPGSEPVSVEDEISRIVPVVRELSKQIEKPISIDTYRAAAAAAALDAGASIINDISGMVFDPDMKSVVARYKCPVIVMHTKGTPKEMQRSPAYEDLMGEVTEYLRQCIFDAVEAGIDERVIIVDPGIGFGKTVDHNLEIIRRLAEFKSLGRPILMGTSRKSTIGQVLGGLPPDERLEGTAATVALSIANGANIVRVHDVKQMSRVAKMTDAVLRGV
ncbi:MAG: dihydropteroate synthase [Armatimonadota bacterium]